jgi:hypothetical protein
MRYLVRPTLMFLAVLVSLALLAPPSGAMVGGLRAGFSGDPDQFLFGGQIEPDPIAENIHIVPSAEVGLGDDLFSLAFNGDFQYRFRTDSGIRPYAGAGLSLTYFDPDNENADSETEFGVNALGGIYFGSTTPMFVDLKLGLTDEVPDFKVVFGINFL